MTIRNILITGGAGFIGTHVARSLVRGGHTVRILDALTPNVHGPVPKNADWLLDGGIDFHHASILSPRAVATALREIDTVIHLAAETGTGQSMYDIARYTEANTQGTAVLLDVMASMRPRSVQRILLASSRAVYGEGAYQLARGGSGRIFPLPRTSQALARHEWEPVCPGSGAALVSVASRETDACRPVSIYAATKAAQEDLVRIACDSLGVDYGILRLQNVYGEGQSLETRYSGILPIFSTRLRLGLELQIHEDGKETRDFVYVGDVADAFLRAVELARPLRTTLNIGSGVATSVLEVAELLSRAMETPSRAVISNAYRLGDVRHGFADIGRARERLGWTPVTNLDDGLRRFAHWVNEQPLIEDQQQIAVQELRERGLMG